MAKEHGYINISCMVLCSYDIVVLKKIAALASYPGRITFHQLDPQPQRLACKEGCQRCLLSAPAQPTVTLAPLPDEPAASPVTQPDDIKLLADPPRTVSPLGDVPEGHSEQIVWLWYATVAF